MITQLTEERLQESDDAEMADAIKADRPNISEEGVKAIIAVLRLRPETRGELIGYFRYHKLICPECGATSCIHGYSDE